MIYAKKGERVTCTKGCLIGTFARDVARGEVFELDMLDWARYANPKRNMPLGNCPLCDAPWNWARKMDGTGGAALNIEGEERW